MIDSFYQNSLQISSHRRFDSSSACPRIIVESVKIINASVQILLVSSSITGPFFLVIFFSSSPDDLFS